MDRRIVVVPLALLNGGWMVVDGTYALLHGRYLGDELGPWAFLARAIGIDPLAPAMALLFLVMGTTLLAVTASYARFPRRMRLPMALAAALVVWYALIGTALSLAILVVLAWPQDRERQTDR